MTSRPSTTSKLTLPSNVAEILEEFKSQRSATRPRIGVGNRNYFLYGQPGATLEDDTIHVVRTRLSFDSPKSESTETQSFLEHSKTNKRLSDTLPQHYIDSKRLAVSPNTSGIDWTPASKEQRSRLLETVDSRINDLQNLVAKNEDFKKQLMDVMESEKLSLQRQKQRDGNMIKLLQEQVESSKDKAFELENDLIKKKGELKELKINSDQEIQNLESERRELALQLREVRHEMESMQMELGQQLEKCQQELELATSKCAIQEEQIGELEHEVVRLRERELKEEVLQESLTLAQQRIQNLELELSTVRSMAQHQMETAKLNTTTTRRVKELEEQVAQGREMVRGKLLLEETVNTLRAQLSSSSQLAEQLTTQQEVSKRKDTELKEWHAMACQLVSGSGEPATPRAVGARVQQLEQSLVVLRSDLNDAMSQIRTASQDKAKHELELKAEQSRCQALQATLDAQAVTMKRVERKLQLIIKERDSIQAVLTAYEGDVTMVGGQLNALQRARIESAERSALELRSMLEEREKELAQTKGSPGNPVGELASLKEKLQVRQTELDKEKSKVATLEEQCERLELLLEQRALRGDYDPSQTKVLHFKMNPQAVETMNRNQEMEQLKACNDKLRERVRVLEAAGASGSASLNTTSLVEENLQIQSNKELVELREKVKQLETKAQRYVDYFKKSSSNFRSAIYLLFGYKTDGLADDTYRLTSLYAEREEDYLLFKILEGDSIELVQTAFSDTIPELIRTYLEEQHSAPAFLSALTLDLFSRTTLT
ncbi:hypothetical protein B566_EDAN006486 [Ephemera danica]|nr:hypothetical protein B566_EDAN006486 [Ephemera danica]